MEPGARRAEIRRKTAGVPTGRLGIGAPPSAGAPARNRIERSDVAIPRYLKDVYTWAYLTPLSVRLLDHSWVVNAILWGNDGRLQRAIFEELAPGRHVLQASCAYGDLSPNLAEFLGPAGQLEVIDVAPIQVENCRAKLHDIPHASVRLADAVLPGGGPYDAAVCFFLLHEVPDDTKRAVVDALLARIRPGGKVVFIDYHRPRRLHPLKWVISLVFAMLEPFARSMWRHDIADLAGDRGNYDWRTETYFGGLFQKTVARLPGCGAG